MSTNNLQHPMKPTTAPGVGDPTTGLRIEWHKVGTRKWAPVVLHWHTYCEFEFVVNGTGIHTLNNVEIPIKRGSAYLCMTNDFHKIKNSPSEEMSVINVKFHESLINAQLLAKLEKIFDHRYCNFEDEDDILRISYLLNLLRDIQSSEYGSRSIKRVLVESTINQIMSLFVLQCLEHENKSSDQTKDEHRIQKAIAYIHKNFTSDISLDDVASYVDLSANYFSTHFKTLMNCSYSSYLLNLRLNYARSLIQSEHISSVNDITQMVGFSSVSYFIKTFKNKFGVTPKEMMYKSQDNHQ